MLCYGNDNRLVVSGCVDGRKLVEADRKTVDDIGRKFTALGCAIQALEKYKFRRVGDGRLVYGRKLLDNDMGVALDLAVLIKELGGSKVIFIGVNKEASLHVLDGHLDGKSGVGLDRSKVLGINELRGWHIVGGRNNTHGGRVTRPSLDLFAVGNGQFDSRAKIDEIVFAR